jgi:hypothetical protein
MLAATIERLRRVRVELSRMLQRGTPTDPTDRDLDDLPADADERTRQDLAERMVPYVRRIRATHPGLKAPHSDAPRGERFVAETLDAAMRELYNPAQLDVLQRINALLEREPGVSRP